MFIKSWRWSIVCVAILRLVLNQAGAAPVTIGVPLPHGQLPGAEMTESMRQSLIDQLKAQAIDAVPLSAATGDLDAEVQAKHCNYVLYTRVEKKHGTGSGVFGKLSLLTHGISPDAAGDGSVKRGDTVVLDYRLLAMGSSDPLRADTLSAKAGSDGEDVVGPLVAQLAGAVAGAAQGKERGAATAQASAQAPTQAASAASSQTQSSSSGSRFGGFFAHRSISNQRTTGGDMGGSVDCAKVASMPNAPMSVEACEKLNGTQQAYRQAASDPSAQRPGDEQMTCAQIAAELRQQQYTAPDKTKVAALDATAREQQKINKKEYENMLKQQAEDQAAVAAASAADTATEVATAGLVRGRALNSVEKTLDAKHKANNERVIKEDLPVTQRMISQTADLGSDFGQQLQANPRLGRLMQLADSNHCKGGG